MQSFVDGFHVGEHAQHDGFATPRRGPISTRNSPFSISSVMLLPEGRALPLCRQVDLSKYTVFIRQNFRCGLTSLLYTEVIWLCSRLKLNIEIMSNSARILFNSWPDHPITRHEDIKRSPANVCVDRCLNSDIEVRILGQIGFSSTKSSADLRIGMQPVIWVNVTIVLRVRHELHELGRVCLLVRKDPRRDCQSSPVLRLGNT